MRNDIWRQWLYYINEGFRIQNKKVLLLVDNAASHIILETDENNSESGISSENDSENEEIQESQRRPRGRPRKESQNQKSKSNRSKRISNLSNITIHYLPPNMTAHIQPMDAGIIHSFKSKYKNLYCHYLIDQFEKNCEQT
jgi:hypothetical protein